MSRILNLLLRRSISAGRHLHPASHTGRVWLLHDGGREAALKLRLLLQRRLFAELKMVPAESSSARPSTKVVGRWLLGCAGMVYGAVAIGGLTRLTESGLSMVNWDLFKTMKPPLNRRQWEEEFERYKQYPEYKFKTADGAKEMTLADFQFIWTMEYLHRMWGRAIGIAFFLPCVYFWARGRFTRGMKVRMTVAGTLLLGQGLFGWYMVKSGLDPSQNSNSDMPRVSQYRLAGHLSLAFILYTVFFWSGLLNVLTRPPLSTATNAAALIRLRRMAHGSKTLIFLTAVMGAFVAGLDAGLVYNSWPKFGDHWVPENMLSRQPAWRNFFENDVTVQFIHRNLAYLTLISITATWLVGRRAGLPKRARLALNGMFFAGYAQAVLGISTLVHFVPVWLAALHQSGSMVLLSFAFWLTNELRRLPK